MKARFSQLHKTLDSYFHKLHYEGVGRQTKHAEVVTSDEEDQLWKGVMNTTTLTGLQNAAFFIVGKMFYLQGGQEHQGLQLSQLKRLEDKYIYYENASKNRNEASSNLESRTRLFHYTHVQKLVSVAQCISWICTLAGYFLKPRRSIYFIVDRLKKSQVIQISPCIAQSFSGKNTLQAKLRNVYREAGNGGHKTSRSLHATAATQMFRQGAPEKVIQE